SQAAIAAYPELGNRGDTLPVWMGWGVDENILNPGDATVRFYQNVLTEVMALFPGRWIHIGGDEAPKTQWQASPLAQTRIRELGATCARGSGTAVDRIRPRREASGVHGVSQGVRPRRGAVDTAGRAGLRRLHQAARHTSPATGRVGRQLPSTRELRAHHCENRPCDPRSRPG